MSLVPRTWSVAGLALATLAALYLAQAGAPVLGFLPGGTLVPVLVVVAGGVAGFYALSTGNPGAGLAAAGIILAGTFLSRLGLPSPLEWAAAILGAAGLVLFLEPLFVAERAAALRTRLEEASDGSGGADPDALAERTVDLRMSQARRTLGVAALLVGGAVLVGGLVRRLLPAGPASSLELQSLYAAVLWVALALIALVAYNLVRGRSRGADDA